MKQRERILLILVVVAVGIYMSDQFGLIDVFANLLSSGEEQVDELLTENQSYRESLLNLEGISRDFASIEGLFDTSSEDREQRYALVTEVDEIARGLGVTRPDIGAPNNEEIPNIEEYQFVTVEVTLRRMPEADLVRFLEDLEESRILVLKMTITPFVNRDELTATFTLAKIERVVPEAAEAEELE